MLGWRLLEGGLFWWEWFGEISLEGRCFRGDFGSTARFGWGLLWVNLLERLRSYFFFLLGWVYSILDWVSPLSPLFKLLLVSISSGCSPTDFFFPFFPGFFLPFFSGIFFFFFFFFFGGIGGIWLFLLLMFLLFLLLFYSLLFLLLLFWFSWIRTLHSVTQIFCLPLYSGWRQKYFVKMLLPASFATSSSESCRTSQVAKLRRQKDRHGIPAVLRSSPNVYF